MIAVIFEVWAADRDAYLDIAADLRPILEKMDGFLSIERFESLTEKGNILSFSSGAMRKRSRPAATSRSIRQRKKPDVAASSGTIACGWPR
jgi:hypothetical protein